MKIEIEKLKDEDNFPRWKFEMKNFFTLFKLSDCVVKDENGDVKEKNQSKLDYCKMVLYACIMPNKIFYISECSTAIDIWKELHTKFENKSSMRKVLLWRRLLSTTFDDRKGFSDYIKKFSDNVFNLKAIEVEIPEELKVSIILRGLPEEYSKMLMHLNDSHFGSSSELITKLYHYDDIFGKKRPQKKVKKCFKCGSSHHLKAVCENIQKFDYDLYF